MTDTVRARTVSTDLPDFALAGDPAQATPAAPAAPAAAMTPGTEEQASNIPEQDKEPTPLQANQVRLASGEILTLQPNEAYLSTGEIATVRRLNGLDAMNLEGLMADAAIRILPGGVGQGTYLRCAAAYALKSKGAPDVPEAKRTPFMVPISGDDLKGRLALFYEDDWGAILAAYLGQSGRGDFRA